MPIFSTIDAFGRYLNQATGIISTIINNQAATAESLWAAGVNGWYSNGTPRFKTTQEASAFYQKYPQYMPSGWGTNIETGSFEPVDTTPPSTDKTPRTYYDFSWYQSHFPGIYNQLGGSQFTAFSEWINYYKQGQTASQALKTTMEGQAYKDYQRYLEVTNWSDDPPVTEPDPGGNINITTPTLDLSGLGLADLISAQPNMEDINTLIDTIVSSGKETTNVGTIIPEPVFAQPKLSPVEMLAFKTKSKRLWSLRQLPINQIIEIYQSIYDTLYGMLQRQKGQTHYGTSIQRQNRPMETSQRRPYRQWR